MFCKGYGISGFKLIKAEAIGDIGVLNESNSTYLSGDWSVVFGFSFLNESLLTPELHLAWFDVISLWF